MDWYSQLFASVVSVQKVLREDLSDHIRTAADTGQLAPIAILAVGLGMIHALTPGHGKAVVVSYFIGKQARPLEGFSMAARAALSHTVSAILLVLLFGHVVSLVGRPSGAASTVQTTSYALIAVTGAYYLYRAIQPSHLHSDHHFRSASILPYAVGVLPCPLTMLVVGHAMALGAYLTGLMLAGLIGVGAAFTIGVFGTLGIISRRGLLGRLDPASRTFGIVLTVMEIGSSIAILALGVILFIGKLTTL